MHTRVRPFTQMTTSNFNGIGLKIGIIVARSNLSKINTMFSQAYETLTQNGVAPEDIHVVSVPSSHDLATVVQSMLARDFFAAIICFGYAMKDARRSHVLVEYSATRRFQWAALCNGVPVIFGSVSTENAETTSIVGRGAECARAAIEIARPK